MGEEGSAFALAEYQVPRHGQEPGVSGGTMPKAAKEKGGLFCEVSRLASVGPGPEKYHKDILERNFVQNIKGGRFSNMGRDWQKKGTVGVVPSVGSYQVDVALDRTKKRPTGGRISRGDRKCYFAQQAEKNSMPAPGKYDPKKLEASPESPIFASTKTESRSPKKASPMGPGYYSPVHTVVEKSVQIYSGSKEASKSFLDKIMSKKEKDKNPPPGYIGIPDSRWQDRQGQALHACRLLLDRPVPQRYPGASPEASPVRGGGAGLNSSVFVSPRMLA